MDNPAGVRHGLDRSRSSLGQRAASTRSRNERQTSPSRSRGGKTRRKEESLQDAVFLDPAQDALDMLSLDDGEEGRGRLAAYLKQHFEPLQRYHVLFEALHALENLDLPPRKKKAMGRTVNSMMTALIDKFPHEVRKALQETDDLVPAVGAGPEHGPASVRDARFLIGAKKYGNVDTPLTPLTILKALIKNFGADNCVQAMETLRSRMMSGL
ncbi:hypothetical protein [Pigmentiphaga sp.]|uniref:hypothetical protein n=1 Tax=Pigmentiphaga sp. TaxID=1977564 RepID=UPI0025EC0150|nr:hypothetical protein [Pigmentiphaga sp.]